MPFADGCFRARSESNRLASGSRGIQEWSPFQRASAYPLEWDLQLAPLQARHFPRARRMESISALLVLGKASERRARLGPRNESQKVPTHPHVGRREMLLSTGWVGGVHLLIRIGQRARSGDFLSCLPAAGEIFLRRYRHRIKLESHRRVPIPVCEWR